MTSLVAARENAPDHHHTHGHFAPCFKTWSRSIFEIKVAGISWQIADPVVRRF